MNIALTVLTWNNLKDTQMLMESLRKETESLYQNHDVCFFISDNGSTDGTLEFLKSIKIGFPIPVEIHEFDRNMGISVAKNVSISKSLDRGCDYMFMFDNDVTAIPGSLQPFIEYMEKNKNTGCFGQHIDFYKRDPLHFEIPSVFPTLDSLNVVSNVKSGVGATRAWTHYSIYRCSIFANGIKFDTDGPFGGAGYGFDDDDLGMQMAEAGHSIDCFKGVYCYHNVNSSVKPLNDENQMNYRERETYLKNKWKL